MSNAAWRATQTVRVLREAMEESASIKNDTPEHRAKLIQEVDGAERALVRVRQEKTGK